MATTRTPNRRPAKTSGELAPPKSPSAEPNSPTAEERRRAHKELMRRSLGRPGVHEFMLLYGDLRRNRRVYNPPVIRTKATDHTDTD